MRLDDLHDPAGQADATLPDRMKEFVMRYTPAALALALVAGLTASAGNGRAPAAPTLPQSRALVEQGLAHVASGELPAAIDAYEAALVIDPANTEAFLALAQVARLQGLQGKAISYYRHVMTIDPDNLSAISGEGEAMVDRGALAKARRNLARLQGLCGENCNQTQQLAAALQRGPAPRVVSADAVALNPTVDQN